MRGKNVGYGRSKLLPCLVMKSFYLMLQHAKFHLKHQNEKAKKRENEKVAKDQHQRERFLSIMLNLTLIILFEMVTKGVKFLSSSLCILNSKFDLLKKD